jgi:hypothetical protein
MMEHFQTVFDYNNNHQNYNVGIILAGTNKFKVDFDKWVKYEHIGIPELNSRIFDWVILKRPAKEEMKEVARMNGLKDEAVLDKIVKECDNYRTLNFKVIGERIRHLKD